MSSSDPKDEKSQNALQTAWLRLKHKILNVEQTEFHADFIRSIEEARGLGRAARVLAKMVRNAAQPNPHFQPMLLSPAGEDNEMESLMKILTECSVIGAIEKKSPKTAEFYKKLSATLSQCNEIRNKFLLQVKNHVIKPLEKYIDEDLAKIDAEYQKLRNCKAHYDDAKNQLRLCRPDRIEVANNLVKETKKTFEKQAKFVSDLLDGLPGHVDNQRKSLRTYTLALRECFDASNGVLLKFLQNTKEV